jgi:hypothetical protein
MRPYTTTSPEGNLIDEIVFATDDLAALRRYLAAHSVQLSNPPVPDVEPSTHSTKLNKKAPPEPKEQPEETFIAALDPEGHRIGFIQLRADVFKSQSDPRGERLIHTGFVGRDGKWQLNLCDPDETRVELMEFKPTKEGAARLTPARIQDRRSDSSAARLIG